jgi:hypothetical protein
VKKVADDLKIEICHWLFCQFSFVNVKIEVMGDSTKANELEDRLIDFAVRIINVADALPATPAGKHISRQILRSGTAPAPNYAEARGADE